MASITKRGAYQFQAQVRRKGYPTQQHTFETRREAESWASNIESEMHRGLFIDRSEAERTRFFDVLDRYARQVTSKKRGWQTEQYRINALKKHPLAARFLSTIKSADIASYRDERLAECNSATVKRELVIISHVFNTARLDWSIPIENPVASIRKPQTAQHRERRLIDDEERRLLEAAYDSKASTLCFCITLALETGMRAGEIVALSWDQIDFNNHTISLNLTKNGERRIVPLTVKAEKAILSVSRSINGGRLTKFYDSRGLSAAFRRACKRAGIKGLRFHDLRHEAASRLAPHMPVATLAKIMGWKTIQMAMRYYNPTPSELVSVIRSIS